MKKLPALSPAEQALMDLIWKHQPVAVSALLEQVNSGRPRAISRNTLQTQLTRLESKGWLRAEEAGRARVYRSLVAETRGRSTILTEIKQRIFGGSLSASSSAFTRSMSFGSLRTLARSFISSRKGLAGRPA
jgi:BlaI family transcriptional regulator, penicillinase repressor